MMRFRVLLSILWTSLISVFDGVHVSAPYSRVGIMQVCTSCHIADISILLNLSFPARQKIVCRAASILPLVFFMWSSRFPFELIVMPRYLYVSVLSRVFWPSLNWGWFFVLPTVITWLFSLPNWMWYFFAVSSVMFSILCSSSLSWCISATSSIHRRHPFTSLDHICWQGSRLNFWRELPW